MLLEINSTYGRIGLGPLQLSWQNTDEEFPGWTVLSWGESNLEFGQIDQDSPGVYMTRYVDGEVTRTRTLLTL